MRDFDGLERALKHGSGRRPLRLDAEGAERAAKLEPADDLTPEVIFEKRWALTVLPESSSASFHCLRSRCTRVWNASARASAR